MESFSYDPPPQKITRVFPKVTIGEMKNVCGHCGVKKRPTKSLGLYCIGGKIQSTNNTRSFRIAQESIIAA